MSVSTDLAERWYERASLCRSSGKLPLIILRVKVSSVASR